MGDTLQELKPENIEKQKRNNQRVKKLKIPVIVKKLKLEQNVITQELMQIANTENQM